MRVWDARQDDVIARGQSTRGEAVAFVFAGDLPAAVERSLGDVLGALAPACGAGLRLEVRLRRFDAWLDSRWTGGDAGSALAMDVAVLGSPVAAPAYVRNVEVRTTEPDVLALSEATVRRLLNESWRQALRELEADARLQTALRARD